jgi:hypothetical protein
VKFGRLTTSLIAFLLFFGPILAYVSGRRGEPVENRTPTNFSELSVSWEGFSTLGKFIGDRIPLRPRAIQVDGWIDQHVFQEDPAFGGGAVPRVIHGKDGVLFLADDFDIPCNSEITPTDTVANLSQFAHLIEDSGRKVIMTFAPNKSTLLPDLLPSSASSRECWQTFTNDFYRALSTSDMPGYVDLKSSLAKEIASTREYLFYRKDSHWDNAGIVTAIREIIQQVKPELWDQSEVSYKGVETYYGDLLGLEGKSGTDEAPNFAIERPEIVPGPTEDFRPGDNIVVHRHYTNTGPADRLIQSKTLLLTDSFGVRAIPAIVPYFADLTVKHFDVSEPLLNIPLIEEAEMVWIFAGERLVSVHGKFIEGNPYFLEPLSISLSTALRDE